MPETKPTVLLVEDDPFMVSLLAQEFSKDGFELLLASDGDDAVAKFKEGRPDALVVDILLPRKSGIEALREIRQLPGGKEVPAVILTNVEDSEQVKNAVELNVAAYLIKANTLMSEIVEKVKQALQR